MDLLPYFCGDPIVVIAGGVAGCAVTTLKQGLHGKPVSGRRVQNLSIGATRSERRQVACGFNSDLDRVAAALQNGFSIKSGPESSREQTQ